MTQKRVLVVEDEALIRVLAVDMLLDLDMAADEAARRARRSTICGRTPRPMPSSSWISACPTSAATT